MAMSKHLSAGSCEYFRSLPNWEEHMGPLLTEANKHDLIVNVHVLTLGKGEEQDRQRENICSLIRECVETAYGREGALSVSNFGSTRFVITLSQENDDKVVGVIVGDYRDYLFTLGFECVAEHMRRKRLGFLLFKASDTVIQCLARDKASRAELPTTRTILVVAYTELGAPLWERKFVEKAGFAAVEPSVPEDEDSDLYDRDSYVDDNAVEPSAPEDEDSDLYDWGSYVDDNFDTWHKKLAY